MRFRFRIPAIPVFFVLLCARIAFPIQHQFIIIDEGIENLLYINQSDSTKNWHVSVSSVYPARDLQLIGNNRVLLGHNRGYTEYNITTGAVMRIDTSFDSVTSVRRLPNGQTLLFGANSAQAPGIFMIKLDSNNVQLSKTTFPGNYVRLVRQTNQGTLLLACNDSLFEADTNASKATGTYIWKKYIPWTAKLNGGESQKHMWEAVRLDNGHIFLSGGYGAFLAEVDTTGKLVDTIGAAPQPAGVEPYFYAMFQRLSNGHYVVANWEGHGTGHDTAGKVHELIEFDTTKTIVWTWDNPALISSLQGVLILDSLNTGLLYDDRNGTMEPLASATPVISPSPARSPGRETPGHAASLSPENRSHLFDLLGRSSAASSLPWTGGKFTDLGAGVYILKSSTGPSEYRQLRN